MTRLLIGALAAALTTAFAAPTHSDAAGPPWVSIEYPVNPYDASTREAFLLVHAFHHGTPMAFPVSGTAEGLVNGARRTVKLDFRSTSRTGVYALNRQWAESGVWTLMIHVAQGPEDRVTALVDIGANGQVAKVSVPTRRESGWVVPASVALADVDAG
ncbi:MAG TPA: hypothetical protein VF981_17615, partial [Gemmatimonadaceae bacterium]